jgi:hypothetical protein
MGYDIHGTEPTDPVGVYFRRSNLAWPPLAALCRELVPEIAQRCTHWTTNDRDGLDRDAAAQLAARLQQLVADGTIADYISQLRAMLARLADKTCDACEGTGRIPRAVVKTADTLPSRIDKDGNLICLACAGAGRVQPFCAPLLLDEDDVCEWVAFLRRCGGFSIR